MQALSCASLLDLCCERMDAGALGTAGTAALRAWWTAEQEHAAAFADALVSLPASEWTDAILGHRAHRHSWYDALARDVTLDQFARFMLENRGFPSFLPLARRALAVQICDAARAALQRNIDDEHVPVPHAALMARLMAALKARAGDGLRLDVYTSLVDRTLVFYFGYYLDAWSLVGSMYVTEAVAQHRLRCMDTGLRRLGLTAHEREFIDIHLACDEDHALDWSERVILPTLRLDPWLRRSIAEGIAVALETSARYLDGQLQRLDERSVAHAR